MLSIHELLAYPVNREVGGYEDGFAFERRNAHVAYYAAGAVMGIFRLCRLADELLDARPYPYSIGGRFKQRVSSVAFGRAGEGPGRLHHQSATPAALSTAIRRGVRLRPLAGLAMKSRSCRFLRAQLFRLSHQMIPTRPESANLKRGVASADV
jgi:hypothetical protein